MENKPGKIRKADGVFIAACLLLAAVLYFVLVSGTDSGTTAVVRINGETVAKYPLGVDGIYELNGGTNLLIIEKGKAHMEDADCPDKLCVKQGTVYRTGQCITCLPNRVTVTIEGGTPEADAVVG